MVPLVTSVPGAKRWPAAIHDMTTPAGTVSSNCERDSAGREAGTR